MLRFPTTFSHPASGFAGTATGMELPEASVGVVNKKDISRPVGSARLKRGGSIVDHGLAKITVIYDADFAYDDMFHKPGLGVFGLPLNDLNNLNNATQSYELEYQSHGALPLEDTGGEETDEVTIDLFYMVSSKPAISPES